MTPYTILLTPLRSDLKRRIAEQEAEARLLGEGLGHLPSGQPVWQGEGSLELSLSHSDHWLAVAFAPKGMRVGIDIEEKEDQAARLLPRYASKEERETLDRLGLPPIYLWCGKEAVYKAHSDRLSAGLSQILLVDRDLFEVEDDEGVVFRQPITYIEGDGWVMAHTLTGRSVPIRLAE
ncbi:MAG: 4'-phosphopantetheinyl transferase superfamily protein [Porphyromonas sp.]|nr:4'-phosphopantetheinyl transferase superfamily protein [Porphyromonas sp.]